MEGEITARAGVFFSAPCVSSVQRKHTGQCLSIASPLSAVLTFSSHVRFTLTVVSVQFRLSAISHEMHYKKKSKQTWISHLGTVYLKPPMCFTFAQNPKFFRLFFLVHPGGSAGYGTCHMVLFVQDYVWSFCLQLLIDSKHSRGTWRDGEVEFMETNFGLVTVEEMSFSLGQVLLI